MRGYLDKAKADVMAAVLVSFLLSAYAALSLVGYGWHGYSFFLFLFTTLLCLNIVVVVLYHSHYLTARSLLFLFAFALASAVFLFYFPQEVTLFMFVVADVLFFTAAMLLAEGRNYVKA